MSPLGRLAPHWTPDTTATAHAAELTLALPDADPDIYRLHQLVWRAVDQQRLPALPCTHRPQLLFRCDGPMLRVRISDSVVHRARRVRIDLKQGQGLQVRARLALWRTPTQALYADARAIESRALDLLGECGLEIDRLDLGALQIAKGHKGQRRVHQGEHRIELPTVEVQAWGRVRMAHLARGAWLAGIGRGRRFGCGMLEYLPA